MATFKVPQRPKVSENNQQIFDQLEKGFGFVPNLYATFAYSKNALANYLTLQKGKTALSNKEKEAVNLVVSQVNDCRYCQAAHTAIGKMNGFNEEQILELRQGFASFDEKLDALVKLAHNITENRGQADQDLVNSFFAVGYDKEQLVDTILLIGDKTIANYLHKTTQVPVDFPGVKILDTVKA